MVDLLTGDAEKKHEGVAQHSTIAKMGRPDCLGKCERWGREQPVCSGSAIAEVETMVSKSILSRVKKQCSMSLSVWLAWAETDQNRMWPPVIG